MQHQNSVAVKATVIFLEQDTSMIYTSMLSLVSSGAAGEREIRL